MFPDYEVTPEPAPVPPTKRDWIGYGLLLAVLVMGILYGLSKCDAALALRVI